MWAQCRDEYSQFVLLGFAQAQTCDVNYLFALLIVSSKPDLSSLYHPADQCSCGEA